MQVEAVEEAPRAQSREDVGISSERLTQQGIYAPTTQAFLNYCLLAIVFGILHFLAPRTRCISDVGRGDDIQRTVDTSPGSSDSLAQVVAELHRQQQSTAGKRPPPAAATHRVRMRRLWPAFAAVAFIDVEANTLVTKAYQYSSLTSVTLLDCFTIPCVMVLSWLVLCSHYRFGHFAGAFCCVIGLLVLVLGDSSASASPQDTLSCGLSLGTAVAGPCKHLSRVNTGTSEDASGSQPLLGDALVLLGAVLYSICNVSQELLLGGVQPRELLAYVGIFGAVISGMQAVLLEHHTLLAAQWLQLCVAGPMLAFAAAMFCFYSLCPQVLIMGGAAVLNISLLTSDVWAALARFFWFGGFQGTTAYFFGTSLALVAVGMVLYALSGSPKQASSAVHDGLSGIQGGAGPLASPHYSRLCSIDGAGMQGDLPQQATGLQV